PVIAERFKDQWQKLVDNGDDMPDSLKQSNAHATSDQGVEVEYAAVRNLSDLNRIEALIRRPEARAMFFLMYTPGQSQLLQALLERGQEQNGPYVRGVVSEVRETADGEIISHGVRVITRDHEQDFEESTTLLPEGEHDNVPSWAQEEFTRRMFFPAGLQAIIHSKCIVIDPLSDDCIVITGSHNFSPAASRSNDENLVIIRGNKNLARIYALHMQTIYDHFAWRAFLAEGGNPNLLFSGLDNWKPGGRNRPELDFWMGP